MVICLWAAGTISLFDKALSQLKCWCTVSSAVTCCLRYRYFPGTWTLGSKFCVQQQAFIHLPAQIEPRFWAYPPQLPKQKHTDQRKHASTLTFTMSQISARRHKMASRGAWLVWWVRAPNGRVCRPGPCIQPSHRSCTMQGSMCPAASKT